MKVILNEHVEHVGDRGTVCAVKTGFARNYLIPKGLAYEATAANMARFQQEQKRWAVGEAKAKGQAEALAGQLAGTALTFTRRAGEGDALYGSVTASDIADARSGKGFPIDRRTSSGSERSPRRFTSIAMCGCRSRSTSSARAVRSRRRRT